MPALLTLNLRITIQVLYQRSNLLIVNFGCEFFISYFVLRNDTHSHAAMQVKLLSSCQENEQRNDIRELEDLSVRLDI